MQRKVVVKLSLPAILALALASPSFAVTELEEVIVTAQKREQNLQDVPMAITAVGRSMLEKNEINTINDLTKLVPSLRFSGGAGDPNNSSMRMRGVGTDVFSVAVEPNVAVVVDNVPLARTGMATFEFADLERIEVLRGPQGTLFGKNASAGLIHIISRDPSNEFESMTRLSYEQPDNYPGSQVKAQFGISGPLTENLGGRFTGFYKKIEGHQEDVLQHKNASNSEVYGIRGKLRWDPSDDLAFRLSIEHQDTETGGLPLSIRSANPEKTERLAPIMTPGEKNTKTMSFGGSGTDAKNQGLTLMADWDIGSVTLTSVTGLRKYKLEGNGELPRMDGERSDVVFNGGPQTVDTFTQEVRLSSTDAGAFEYTVGALWFDNRLDNDFSRTVQNVPLELTLRASGIPEPVIQSLVSIPGGGDSLEVYTANDGNVDTENLGVFAQGTWHLADTWHLTAGSRYIHEKVTANVDKYDKMSIQAIGLPISNTEFHVKEAVLRDTAVTGTLSLQYDLSESAVLYTTVATGYRGGAFDFASSDPEAAFKTPVDPETALNFEVGIKSRLLDNRVELNVTAFQTTFKDFQAQIIDLNENGSPGSINTGNFRLANAGELRTQGLEIEMMARPIEPLFITGSLLYNVAEFQEFETQCFVGQQPGESGGVDSNGDGSCDYQDLAGATLPNAPEWSASITTRYEHQFEDVAQSAYVQLTGRWQDEVQFNTEQHPLAIQDAYSIWDLRMGWKGMSDNLEIAGYVKNLFGQYYVSSIIPTSLVNDRRDLFQVVPVDSDRVFGLSLSYSL